MPEPKPQHDDASDDFEPHNLQSIIELMQDTKGDLATIKTEMSEAMREWPDDVPAAIRQVAADCLASSVIAHRKAVECLDDLRRFKAGDPPAPKAPPVDAVRPFYMG
jgi:hypothetical protein